MAARSTLDLGFGHGGRREAASARRMGCRGKANCRPGQTDHGERGKRPVRAGLLVAARQGPMPADGRWAWRSPRSSPRAGKPSTWRRRTAGPQHHTPFGRSGVNTPAPLAPKCRGAGTGMADEAAPMGSPGRAAALRRPVQPGLRPRDVARRVGAGETQPGVKDRRCRWPDPQACRADGR